MININEFFSELKRKHTFRKFYFENDQIEFKLKLNILEYLILSSRQIFLTFETDKYS